MADMLNGFRKGYKAITGCLAANRWVAGSLFSAPTVYMIAFLIYQSTQTGTVENNFTKPLFIIFGVLIGIWLISIVCLWRKWPNVLTPCVFVYRCTGHWTLVSFVLLILYGAGNVGYGVGDYLVALFLPMSALLLLTADLMAAAQDKLFKDYEVGNAVATLAAEHSALPAAGGAAAAVKGGGDP